MIRSLSVVDEECIKKPYETRKEAKRELKWISLKNHWAKNKGDVYYCDRCSNYHITSMNTQNSRNFTRYKITHSQ